MPKVSQFLNTLSAADGGPARHALEVNIALNNLGIDAQLVVFRDSGDSIEPHYRERKDFPSPGPLTLGGKASALRLSSLPRVLSSSVWVVHGYYLKWIPPVVLLGWILRKRLLLMPHGALTEYDRNRRQRRKRLFHRLAGWWMNRVVNFAVATASEDRDLRNVGGVRSVAIVGAGANAPVSPNSSRPANRPVRLLSMSRIAPKKRIDKAIAAVAAMDGLAELYIAGTGEGELTGELQRLSETEGVESLVHFVGHLEGAAKEALYRDSDIFLLLSDDENFGIGLADALARGLPAVVSDAVAAADGLPPAAVQVLPDATPQAVRDAVETLLGQYETSRREAESVAERYFSWAAVARRWESVIDG